MNILEYKKANVVSPLNLRNHNMHNRKKPGKKMPLEDFIGRFQAKEKINCVNLKLEFKNWGV